MNILIEEIKSILPIKKYGGTQRVIWGLGKELSKLGHSVYFLVKKGSHCDFATIIPYDEGKNLNDQIPDHIDIVHMNHRPNITLNTPYLITMHGNTSIGELLDINTVFVSKNHAKRHGTEVFIHNGIDWNDYPYPILDNDRKNVHFLGKASWKVKNVFGTIKIALKSGNKIHIIGGNRWTFRNFKRGFNYLLNKNVIFHGMLDNDKKIALAQTSKALVFPVVWHEPFGLAITESLYAGCAVFGTKNGSLPELITPEIGFIANSSDEIAKAIKEFDYNPKRCHEHAVKYYNSKVMTESYLQLYKKVIAGETINKEIPRYIEEKNIISKLD